jgi:hypothetical protein
VTAYPPEPIRTVMDSDGSGRKPPGDGGSSWTPDPGPLDTTTARPRLGNDDRAASTSTQQDASPEDGTASRAARVSAALAKISTTTTGALDAVTPYCAPFASKWHQVAEGRRNKRTPQARKRLDTAVKSLNKARTDERTAKAAYEAAKANSGFLGSWSARRNLSGARSARRTASREARAARREFPELLHKVAARAHLAHTTVTGAASLVMHSPWPVTGSATAAALMYGALWVGGRDLPPSHDTGELVPTAEETALLERLAPAHWAAHCEERRLANTLTTEPRLTPSGIQVKVRLDGDMTPDRLRAAEQHVRALLRMREGTRLEIRPGRTGGWARMTLRTRNALGDASDLLWTPSRVGIGVDEITGDPVDVPIVGTHKLVAGVTNMGKSVSWRPWMMQAVRDPLMTGVLLDPKRQEGRLWEGKIRTEGHQRGSQEDVYQAIYDAIVELGDEMEHRQAVADVTQWVPTPEYPLIFVVIEEGAAIMRMAKQKRWKDIIDRLEAIYTLARAVGIWVLWATQYPSKEKGVPQLVTENALCKMALTVDAPLSDRVIFGENAADKGWTPSELNGVPGRALIRYRGRKANPLRIWFVTDDMVTALPDTEPWRTRAHGATPPIPPTSPTGGGGGGGGRTLTLVKAPEADTNPAAPTPEPTTDELLLAELLAGGPRTQTALAKATGVAKATTARALDRLEGAGKVRKQEDGTYTADGRSA